MQIFGADPLHNYNVHYQVLAAKHSFEFSVLLRSLGKTHTYNSLIRLVVLRVDNPYTNIVRQKRHKEIVDYKLNKPLYISNYPYYKRT